MEEHLKMVIDEDDEQDSKETVFHRYFLREWTLLESLLDDIISNGRVSNISSVHKIRSIVLSLFLLRIISSKLYL